MGNLRSFIVLACAVLVFLSFSIMIVANATAHSSKQIVVHSISPIDSVLRSDVLWMDKDFSYQPGDSIPIWVVTGVCPEKRNSLGDVNFSQSHLTNSLEHQCKFSNDGIVTYEVTLKYAILDSFLEE